MGQDFTSFTVPIFPFISDVFKSANVTERLLCTRYVLHVWGKGCGGTEVDESQYHCCP